MRVAAIIAATGLVTWSGSVLWERWRLHQWFEGTIGNPSSSGQSFDLDMRPLEDGGGILWFVASLVCTVLAASGYAVLRRRVRTPKALLGLGGLLFWVLPMFASTVSIQSIESLQQRPDQLVTMSNILWTLVLIGGVVVVALAIRQPKAVRQP